MHPPRFSWSSIRRAAGRIAAGRIAAGLLAAMLIGSALGVTPVAARDPWTPRGPAASDRERHDPAPRGFRDARRPVIVPPNGPLRPATTDRTNIVVLMVDDIPEMDERLWQRLPTIRRLFLQGGLRFTNFHGNDPLCCPGRVNFLTGLTTDHHGVWTNDVRLFDPRVTVATELKASGYYTVLAGKYLNGPGTVRRPRGWSRAAITKNAYYRYTEYVDGRVVYHGQDAADYQPDVAFNRAMQFLRDAPPDQPIFAWITPFTVHAGWDPYTPTGTRWSPVVPLRFQGDRRCAGLGNWWTPAHADDNADRPRYQRGWNEARGGYPLERACESLLAVDHGLARVTRELKAQGRLDDTLLILTADNGMGWGAHGKRGKTVSFATQIPLYVRWPAGRGTSPATDPSFLSNVDLAPTLCAVGGCAMGPYPDGLTGPDGTSFLGVITGDGPPVVREALYQEHLAGPLWRSVLTTPRSPLGRWHYTEYSTWEKELYDASGGPCWTWQTGDPGDPCELTNLAGRPETARVQAALHDLLAAAVASGGADRRFSGH